MKKISKIKIHVSSTVVWSLLLLVIFGSLMTFAGINSLTKNTSYYLPIYVSQRLVVTENGDEISVVGAIKNLTSEYIVIDEINIHLNGDGGYKTVNYANVKINNISLAPNETYQIDKIYPYSYSDLDNAYISYFTINSEKYYDIKYSQNGVEFENQSPPTALDPLFLPLGIILLVSAVVVFIIAIKPKETPSENIENSKYVKTSDLYKKDILSNKTQIDVNKQNENFEIIKNNNIVTKTNDVDDTEHNWFINKIFNKQEVLMTSKMKMEKYSKIFTILLWSVLKQNIYIYKYTKLYIFWQIQITTQFFIYLKI